MKKISLWVFLLVMLFPVFVQAQGLPLKDGTASTLATISDCSGSINCVRSTGSTTVTGAGFQGVAGATGVPLTASNRRFVPIQGAEGGGLRQASHGILFEDTFNATVQNTSIWKTQNTTQTLTETGGFVNINSGVSVAINTNSSYQTFRTFPLFGKSEIRFTVMAQHTVAPQTNATTEWGLFTATLPGAAVPTDGCFFRFNAAAEFRGVCNNNATEVQTAALTATSINVVHDYTIVIGSNAVFFLVDESVVGTITLLTDAPGVGQAFLQATVPMTFRHYIAGSAPATGMQFKVATAAVHVLGPDSDRTYGEQRAGYGLMAYQHQNGNNTSAVAPTTAQFANNTNPAAAVPTNTTAALGSGLGGKFQETLTLAAATDGIISSYQNPVGSVNITPRNLIIKGVCIGGVLTVAVTVTTYGGGNMSLAYGHTAVSLATAETATFATPTTKAPRRIALYSTAIAGGTLASQIIGTPVTFNPGGCISFTSPVVIAPGEFAAITHNKWTAAPTTGVISWTITFDAYFE